MQRFAFLVNHFFNYFLSRSLVTCDATPTKFRPAFPSVAALFRCVFSGEANYSKAPWTCLGFFQFSAFFSDDGVAPSAASRKKTCETQAF
jgi:hypothetical protein